MTPGDDTVIRETPDTPRSSPASPPAKRFAVEAAIGLVVALLLLWVAIASTTDVPFVYQGI